MATMRKLARPEGFPGRTVWGAVKGPVVHLGNLEPVVPGVSGGYAAYIDERESRELIHAWGAETVAEWCKEMFGWPLPEEHAARDVEFWEQIANLQAELEAARADQVQVVSLADALATAASAATPAA